MDVIEAIKTRRTATTFARETPSRALIADLLDVAVWAPNHRLNEPWRFIVIAGDYRAKLGNVFADDALEGVADKTTTEAQGLADAQRKKATRAPVVIAVATEAVRDPKILHTEDVCAVACATQNLMLAAHARGLTTKWSTGACSTPRIKRFLGLNADDEVLAFVYLGFPAGDGPTSQRADAETKTAWMGWPE
ncbi:MAG: nitroreductase [Chloroflexota bacterium]